MGKRSHRKSRRRSTSRGGSGSETDDTTVQLAGLDEQLENLQQELQSGGMWASQPNNPNDPVNPYGPLGPPPVPGMPVPLLLGVRLNLYVTHNCGVCSLYDQQVKPALIALWDKQMEKAIKASASGATTTNPAGAMPLVEFITHVVVPGQMVRVPITRFPHITYEVIDQNGATFQSETTLYEAVQSDAVNNPAFVQLTNPSAVAYQLFNNLAVYTYTTIPEYFAVTNPYSLFYRAFFGGFLKF